MAPFECAEASDDGMQGDDANRALGNNASACSPTGVDWLPTLRADPQRCFRLEWRRPASDLDEGSAFDLRFETAADPARLRRHALRIADGAYGREFRLISPEGEAVWTNLEAIRAWSPRDDLLPAADASSLWARERRIAAARCAAVGAVRAAVLRGAADGIFFMEHAIMIFRIAEATAGGFTRH